jgi:hypothetical protein
MKTHPWTVTGLLLIAALVVALGWFQYRLYADDAPEGEEGLNTKLGQLLENNGKMEETLKAIETNLQFSKSRAMSGGRN